jgi:signal transduction histidine kinase
VDEQNSGVDWVDLKRLRRLFEEFSQAVGGLTIVLWDHPGGNVLLAVNERALGLDDRRLKDCALPIVINGKVLATLATGPLRVKDLPVESDEKARNRTSFLAGMVSYISDLRFESLENIRRVANLDARVKRQTDELASAHKEMESFSYSVSHDLRAPLRGIDGWSHALFEDYNDQFDEQARQYLTRVRSESQRMGRMIEDLLKLSRITGRAFKPSQVDLSDMAERIASQLKVENPGRRIEFVVQPGLCVEGDATLLEIAMDNLLSNAVKFTGRCEDARIEFGKTDLDSNPVYFVRDNGVGFEMAYAQKLFGVFQRMHRTTDFSGNGIGLAIVQRILRRHGGRIWAQSAVDQGATFYFTLS